MPEPTTIADTESDSPLHPLFQPDAPLELSQTSTLEELMQELRDLSTLEESTSESLNIAQLMSQLTSAEKALDTLGSKTDNLLAKLDAILVESGEADEQLSELKTTIQDSSSVST
ncbi:hypothetical protein BATDEDRAFT_23961 [Batrachochytrium dendrobatidis JAM81]|uniref:Uncharacterized protein n=2 Tax=Batrachochytrium dendrobatidis TaxID=109871 RepID=F4P009_BATDJ|nr:uncharacterized protein BATDEDRAFT_23961 [Batrachochytrium dendrobatidis JAM81]EGF81492.1 hypothetical protein BATDEDRAFT_23961 [Batrachochytrium dendrobatidis JAM81]KAJ8326025.1 hypothetical protein O5D80_005660 [Batrachochytrium dendrobatidis]KAK5670026.1 hypothetical protein QVD99_003515 [Batrachochytrium dendrobatidis]OAJ38348.1 hypothetical protein BDEG_22292 [Batrachochytrium dendrobatidis JEL423]|eukprot:XP_006677881.1 hypothetical protein BATDEDRAFT_23961 [Batrachochytrium dendrobatidis JAM81]